MYPTPAERVVAEIEIKKSRFIAWLEPVKTPADVSDAVQRAHQQYPNANHHCYAYLLGPSAAAQAAMFDDGEPSGTAGKPILNVIQHKGVSDIAIIVIRYFGGVKLGAGGLVRAYAASAEAVLSRVNVTEQVPMCDVTVRADFAGEQPLRHWLACHKGIVMAVDYGQQVHIHVSIPVVCRNELDEWTQGQGMTCL